MRKSIVALFTVALLGLGSAFAQDGMMANQLWVGVSGGFPGVAVHVGLADVVAGLDVRANVGFNYTTNAGIGSGFAIGVDALYALPLDVGMEQLDVYVGGGPSIILASPDLGVALNIFGGAEYHLTDMGLPEGAVFLEAGPAIALVPAFNFGVGARLGFNYYF